MKYKRKQYYWAYLETQFNEICLEAIPGLKNLYEKMARAIISKQIPFDSENDIMDHLIDRELAIGFATVNKSKYNLFKSITKTDYFKKNYNKEKFILRQIKKLKTMKSNFIKDIYIHIKILQDIGDDLNKRMSQ